MHIKEKTKLYSSRRKSWNVVGGGPVSMVGIPLASILYRRGLKLVFVRYLVGHDLMNATINRTM